MAWFHWAALDDHDRALEEFTALRDKYPSDAVFTFCLGLIKRTQGEWEEAVAEIQRAIRLNPRSTTFRGECGVTLYYLRRYAEAESLYNRELELKPDAWMPHSNKVLLRLMGQGDLKGARQVLQEALRKVERLPKLTILEALLEMAAGNFDRALTLLEDYGNSGELSAYDTASLYNLKGSACRYSNQTDLMEAHYDSARVILEKLVLAEPDDAWNHSELGLTYAGLGGKQEAIREGELAVELEPVAESAMEGSGLELNLADIYVMVGEYDRAIEKLDYLLSIPSEVSVPSLRIWPEYDPLRNHPRFQEMLEKYEKEHGS
jgi:tetratricopeptide (TPR) repeat protein